MFVEFPRTSDSHSQADPSSPAFKSQSTSFSADSPYFHSYVDSEVEDLSVLKSTLLEISKNARAFGKCGEAMAQASRNLSASCKLQTENLLEGMNGEDEKDSFAAKQRLFELKRKCIGEEMFAVLKLLGSVLDEIANAQLQMCQSLQASLSVPLEEFAEKDVVEANRLRSEAYSQTDFSEKAFSTYINYGTMNQALANQLQQGNARSSGSRFAAWGSGIKAGISRGSSATKNDEGAPHDDMNQTLNSVCNTLTNAELARFNTLQYLDSIKTRRDFELGEAVLATLIGFKAYFHHCSDLTQGIRPKINFLQNEQSKSRNKLESQQKPWEKQQSLLTLMLDKFDSRNLKHNLEDNDIDREAVENKFGIWKLQDHFSDVSVYRRAPSSDVVIEGWLYRKNDSRIALNAWSRRWFIVENSGIYYLKREGVMNFISGSTETEREKICDIVLCTVKECSSHRFCFELVSPAMKPILLKACGPAAFKKWIDSIRGCIESNLGKSQPTSDKPCVPTFEVMNREATATEHIPTWNPNGESFANHETDVHSNVGNVVVRKVLDCNKHCADCGREHPDWVSLNQCVLVCIECSGIHRSLGVHISKVRSMKMDDLSEYEYALLLATGNEWCNSIYEARIPSGWNKPNRNENRESREKWIKSKYMWRGFIDIDVDQQEDGNVDFFSEKLYEAAKKGNLEGVVNSFCRGGQVNWINYADAGRSALHACALSGRSQNHDLGIVWKGVECAEFLIQNGARIDALDMDQSSALDCVILCQGGRIEMVDYLNNRMKAQGL